jgi:putative Mn2+ efflux pump MntP
MYIIPILLFSISANIDNLAAGVSYGIQKIVMPLSSNFVIAFIVFAGTLFSMILGKSISPFMPVSVSNYIGGSIIIGIGAISIVKYFKNRKNSEQNDQYWEEKDKNNNKRIEFREALILGVALSINNMGLGIGASISGLSVIPTAACSFVFSLAFMFAGNFLGNSCFSKYFGKFAELVSGSIIIMLGIFQFIF